MDINFQTNMNKTLIAGATIILLGGGLYSLTMDKNITLENAEVVDWTKPTTVKGWQEDTKKEGLNFKFDYQLVEMKETHLKSLEDLKSQYDRVTQYPDSVMWELKEQGFEGEDLTLEFNNKIAQIKFQYERYQQIIERIDHEIALRKMGTDRTADLKMIKPSTPREAEELSKLK